jgi:hypothetical protein
MIDFLPPTAAPKEIPKVNTFPIKTKTLPSPYEFPFALVMFKKNSVSAKPLYMSVR